MFCGEEDLSLQIGFVLIIRSFDGPKAGFTHGSNPSSTPPSPLADFFLYALLFGAKPEYICVISTSTTVSITLVAAYLLLHSENNSGGEL